MVDLLEFILSFLAVAACRVAFFAALVALVGCSSGNPRSSASSGSAASGDTGQCRPATDLDCVGPAPFTCKGFDVTPGEFALTICDGPAPTGCELLYECPRANGLVPLWCCK